MSLAVEPVEIVKVGAELSELSPDLVVAEEPLEIRVGHGPENGRSQFSLSVTMRTPGADEQLCMGFLFTEGIINSREDVLSVKYCEDLGRHEGTENLMRVELHPRVELSQEQFKRNFYTTSSCGVCGKASVDAIKVNCQPVPQEGFGFKRELLFALPEKLKEAQQIFRHTGGLHASALFNEVGELLLYQEDVGRHNALDKLIGAMIVSNANALKQSLLLLSGRVSFELVQKAVRAGIPMIAAVGAPSGLAVRLAKEFGVTLVGFLKPDRFNIYTGKERVL